ncbi:hypothetical protein [Streptomyces sp. NPDC004528]|uniref:hypothetical protein n=1 Tax=Streptomyces sp. NPDC004528 TaxID=3154550 RepID=UPI0033BC2947
MEFTYRRRSPARKSCENCGRRNVGGAEHAKPDGTPCKFVLIYRTYFTEDMIHDGDFGQSKTPDGKFGPGPRFTYEAEDCTPKWATTPEDNSVKLAIDAIRDADCAYDEGCDWFYHCDGSYDRGGYSGERVEPSAHLYGFSEAEVAHIHRVIQRAWIQRRRQWATAA